MHKALKIRDKDLARIIMFLFTYSLTKKKEYLHFKKTIHFFFTLVKLFKN